MSASSIYGEPDMGDHSDGENEQDNMLDPNFVDNSSLPQRPQQQQQDVWGDDDSLNIDPDLNPPPTECQFRELFETITEAHQAHRNKYGIDPNFNGYRAYNGYMDNFSIDNASETVVENINSHSTATVSHQEVAPTNQLPDELQQVNDFAQPQQHGLPPSVFELPGANAAGSSEAVEVQRAVDQQTSMTNLPPSIQIYSPDGQLTTSPTWLAPDLIPFHKSDTPSSPSPELQDFSTLQDDDASKPPLEASTHLSVPDVQDQQLPEVHPSSSFLNDGSPQSWFSRNHPHLFAATMSSSGNAQAQDLDFDPSIYDDDPPLNPSYGNQSVGNQATSGSENRANGSSGPNSGQNSTQNTAAPTAPEQTFPPVYDGNIRTPRYTENFTCFISPGPGDLPEANCYVECLTPVQKDDASKPVLFLHGDHHTGWTWKYLPGQTETNLSWVDYFLQQGNTCYVPDMPMSGRSMGALLVPDNVPDKGPKLNAIEGELTSPRDNLFPLYDTARYHCQFPGIQQNPPIDQDVAGLRWDPYFRNYQASRVPVWNSYEERVAYGAEAVTMILDRIGEPAIIIAEGLGGMFGLIASDRSPDKVAGLILMGYPYAPFARPFQLTKFDNGVGMVYHKDTMEECTALTNGLTSFDLHFDPPLALMESLDVVKTFADEDKEGAYCFLQDADKPVRKLVNVAKVPILVVTPEAGKNSAYDWSVVSFLRQAGVAADWYKLARFGLLGNGQLLWMEKNSARAAKLVQAWIVAKTTADADAAAAAAAILAVRPDQVALADRREEEVRGTTGREAARYAVALEEREEAWAGREIAPLVQANADAMECFYSWLPVLDVARADFQAAQAATAAAAAPAAGAGDGAAAAP
ncbi:hypothetical protein PspLS_09104 [Pyricularia sp. CBS 133598]|nr:hypothetical protein PspLS_09104 [Pyricularia sp. CBS 133598]